ncbi:MAG: hypothetical protein J0G94_14700 [Sphingomonadales bacterium]|nr:hypothetical protein [Sphingomonadales bacterium]
MNGAAIDRLLISRTLILWLILLWPLVLFGGPAVFPDTASYYKGGAVAVDIVTEKLVPAHAPAVKPATPEQSAQPAGGTEGADNTRLVRDVKGVRSVSYSVFSYVFSGPGASLIPLAAMQGLFLAICLAATFNAATDRKPRHFWTALLVLAFATTLAPYICYAMPDVFAGATILLLALIGAESRRLSTPLLLLLVVMAAFAITTHPSHIPLAAAMVAMTALLTVARAIRGDRAAVTTLVRMAGLLAFAMVAVIATGIIGFGEASIAPKRYPFALARSLEIPPARAHLLTMCKSQPLQVCKLYTDQTLPTSSYDFLWGEHGIENIATTQQMQALRDEEPAIVWDMLRSAPFRIGWIATEDVLRQLATFDLGGLTFGQRVQESSPVTIEFVKAHAPWRFPLRLVDGLSIASVLLSLVAFALWLRRSNRNAALATMLIGGVVANAAICSMLSTVASRYQARVVWLLPLAALLLWAGRRGSRLALPSPGASRRR